MEIVQDLLNQRGTSFWFFIPSALFLGVLHGLEPGHSKTLMAAFIVSIRGTVTQAVLLGICATLSHSLVIWALAAFALHYGSHWNVATTEPYFQIASAAIILGLALWMFWRTFREHRAAMHHHRHHHSHSHDLERPEHSSCSHAAPFDDTFQDAHERTHTADIARHFQGRNVNTGQIILFGLTGGLLPCPAALTILLVCLQLKQVALGITLVLCFSLGLAIILVGIGAATAWGIQRTSQKLRTLSKWARKAPYLSSALLSCLAVYMAFRGWQNLHLPLVH